MKAWDTEYTADSPAAEPSTARSVRPWFGHVLLVWFSHRPAEGITGPRGTGQGGGPSGPPTPSPFVLASCGVSKVVPAIFLELTSVF